MRRRIGPLAATSGAAILLVALGSVAIALIAADSSRTATGAARIGWILLASISVGVASGLLAAAPFVRRRVARRLRGDRELARIVSRLESDVRGAAAELDRSFGISLDRSLGLALDRVDSGHAALERVGLALEERIDAIDRELARIREELPSTVSAVREAEGRRRADVRVELSHASRELADQLTVAMFKLSSTAGNSFTDLIVRHLRDDAPGHVLQIGVDTEAQPSVESLVAAHGGTGCLLTSIDPAQIEACRSLAARPDPIDLVVVHAAPHSAVRSPRAAWYEMLRPCLADDSVILLADHERDRAEVLEWWTDDPCLTAVRSDTDTAPEEQGGIALRHRGRGTRSLSSPGRFVLVKGRFGMGGRLAVLATAAAYAERTDRRLVVDWNDPAYWTPGGPDVYSALFDAPNAEPLDPIELVGASVHPVSWRTHLEKFTCESPGRVVPYELAFDRPPDDHVDADVVVVTRDEPRLPDLRDRLRRTTPILALRAEIDDFAEAQQVHEAIGVHVRHGNGEFLVDPPDLEWYVGKVGEARAARPDAPIFLATDSPQVLDQLASRFDQVVTVPKWYPLPTTGSLHHHRSNPDPLRSAGHAVMDIWLLSRCRDLILSPGGFSTAARLLSDTPPDRVSVYPGKVHAPRSAKRGWINPP